MNSCCFDNCFWVLIEPEAADSCYFDIDVCLEESELADSCAEVLDFNKQKNSKITLLKSSNLPQYFNDTFSTSSRRHHDFFEDIATI
ncbi:hypothetical protein RIR_jg28188.t1 [Rhizophagus irregularis DAOM 181602=DAOM 197198]|nr:hypothetical protein RIR_jg28188.t1 [Rhizophagus irregularis DAOM 181602=DAOM 197198]